MNLLRYMLLFLNLSIIYGSSASIADDELKDGIKLGIIIIDLDDEEKDLLSKLDSLSENYMPDYIENISYNNLIRQLNGIGFKIGEQYKKADDNKKKELEKILEKVKLRLTIMDLIKRKTIICLADYLETMYASSGILIQKKDKDKKIVEENISKEHFVKFLAGEEYIKDENQAIEKIIRESFDPKYTRDITKPNPELILEKEKAHINLLIDKLINCDMFRSAWYSDRISKYTPQLLLTIFSLIKSYISKKPVSDKPIFSIDRSIFPAINLYLSNIENIFANLFDKYLSKNEKEKNIELIINKLKSNKILTQNIRDKNYKKIIDETISELNENNLNEFYSLCASLGYLNRMQKTD